MYRTLLDDDGTLARSLRGDRRFRAKALRMMLNAIDKPETGLPLLERIGDRIEGKPVHRIAVTDPQPIEIHLHSDEGTADPAGTSGDVRRTTQAKR
jgi:hypothetical protein